MFFVFPQLQHRKPDTVLNAGFERYLCLKLNLHWYQKQFNFTLFTLDTCKQVLWQTVKTQMKCSIRQHFIRACTVSLDKNNLQEQKYIIFYRNVWLTTPSTTKWKIPYYCIIMYILFVWFFTSKSTAMVMSRLSVHQTTPFSLASLTKWLTSTSCTYFRL